MDEPQKTYRPDKAHDLRHQLALLAVDLRLSRDRLARSEQEPGELVPSLLNRLDRGLARAQSILEEGAAPGAEASLDRAPLVREIWERFHRAGRLNSDRCRLDLPDPWLFPGSEEALHALLLNLLENACKAAPQGPLHLTVDGEGIAVENGGEALPEPLADSLRAGRAPETEGEHGRGLGEILRRAEQLGLRMEIDTSPLTRMTFRRIDGPRLLVVEDDPGLRAMLAELIRRDGFRVDEAARFEDLPAEAGPWRAVLADLGLPGEDGGSALARIKDEHPATRTLLLTGDREEARGGHPGVDRVLIKPGLAPLQEELRILKEGAP